MGEVDPHIWDRFDMVAVLSYTGYKNRQPALWAELERVGLKDRVEWRYDFPNPFMERFANSVRLSTTVRSVGAFAATMAHYRALKVAYETGRTSLLVLEDDVKFLRDAAGLAAAVGSIPADFDVAKLEWAPRVNPSPPPLTGLSRAPDSVSWVPHDGFWSWGNAAIAYSRRGMEWKIRRMEEAAPFSSLHAVLEVSDGSDVDKLFQRARLKAYVASPLVAVQDPKMASAGLHGARGYKAVQLAGGSFSGYGWGDGESVEGRA